VAFETAVRQDRSDVKVIVDFLRRRLRGTHDAPAGQETGERGAPKQSGSRHVLNTIERVGMCEAGQGSSHLDYTTRNCMGTPRAAFVVSMVAQLRYERDDPTFNIAKRIGHCPIVEVMYMPVFDSVLPAGEALRQQRSVLGLFERNHSTSSSQVRLGGGERESK
jgi:hypothetical protein